MNSPNKSLGTSLKIKDLNLKPGPTFTIHELVIGFEAQKLQDKGLSMVEIAMTLMREGILDPPKGWVFHKEKND